MMHRGTLKNVKHTKSLVGRTFAITLLDGVSAGKIFQLFRFSMPTGQF